VVSSRAYERAIRLGPARDALWLESAEWMKAGGLEERAVARLERLPDIGSRDRRVYYALSTLALGKRKTAEAASLMSTAWKLEPIPRAEILASPAVSALLGIDEVAELVSISAPREPKFRVAGETPFAVRFPAESDATVTGSLLVVTIGESELVVPGGSQLAPETGARLLDAVEREEMETARRLDDFDALVESSPSVTLAQPSLRERFTRTAEALAERGRWNDVERLTNSCFRRTTACRWISSCCAASLFSSSEGSTTRGVTRAVSLPAGWRGLASVRKERISSESSLPPSSSTTPRSGCSSVPMR
jgi:hypothetical protein